jgi:hypothetical protein
LSKTHIRLLDHLVDAAIKDEIGVNDAIIGANHHWHVGTEAVQKESDTNRGGRQVMNRDRLIHRSSSKDRVRRRNSKRGRPTLQECLASDTPTSSKKMAYAEGEPGGFRSQNKDLRCGCSPQGGLGTMGGQRNTADHHLQGESTEIMETGVRGGLTS